MIEKTFLVHILILFMSFQRAQNASHMSWLIEIIILLKMYWIYIKKRYIFY